LFIQPINSILLYEKNEPVEHKHPCWYKCFFRWAQAYSLTNISFIMLFNLFKSKSKEPERFISEQEATENLVPSQIGSNYPLTPLLVCSFEMCAGVPTIKMKIFEMKIFHGLLVRYNPRLCCIPTMAFPKNFLL
jgi:hypothetical protein